MRIPVAMVVVLFVLAVPVSAASPGPTARALPASPPSSTAPALPAADCRDLAALLPARVGDGIPLTATRTSGVEGIDPDDLLDPFLDSMGLGRSDVCGLSLRTGDDPTDAAALLLRVRGARPGLATPFAAAIAKRVRGYGQAVVEDGIDVDGRAVRRLSITASGVATVLLIAAASPDAVLLTESTELLRALLPSLPGEPVPAPSGEPVASASLVPVPSPGPSQPAPSQPAPSQPAPPSPQGDTVKVSTPEP